MGISRVAKVLSFRRASPAPNRVGKINTDGGDAVPPVYEGA
jgi:hypothetical protein